MCVFKAVAPQGPEGKERECDVITGVPRARERTSAEKQTEPRPPTQWETGSMLIRQNYYYGKDERKLSFLMGV